MVKRILVASSLVLLLGACEDGAVESPEIPDSWTVEEETPTPVGEADPTPEGPDDGSFPTGTPTPGDGSDITPTPSGVDGATPEPVDTDRDGVADWEDNCPEIANPSQRDTDQDGAGDVCDPCPSDNPDDPDQDGECGRDDAAGASFDILGTVPDDGFQAVATALAGKIYFTAPYPGDVNKVLVAIEDEWGRVQFPQVVLFEDEATFLPVLEADTDYCMTVEIAEQAAVPAVWPLVHEACFTTRVPCGVPVDVGHDAAVVRLGGGERALNALNALLQRYSDDYPIALLLEDIARSQTFPVEGLEAAMGAWRNQDGIQEKVLYPEGYTASFPECAISGDGTLTCRGFQATIPFYSDGMAVHLYLAQPRFSGTLEQSGDITTMDQFTLTGAVTPENVARMEQELGVEGVSALLVLDVDLDGDGAPDAASVEVRTHPRPLDLLDAACR